MSKYNVADPNNGIFFGHVKEQRTNITHNVDGSLFFWVDKNHIEGFEVLVNRVNHT